MAINLKTPPLIQTVGAMYLCFNTMDLNAQWTNKFAADVEKLKSVKQVKVSENTNSLSSYGSGDLYDSDSETASTDIEVETMAFPDDTLAIMKGDNIDKKGLILSGGKRIRPYFAYGKVVKLRNNNFRFEWYPKCKLSDNSDDAKTSEEKMSEQTSTYKITAFPFNDAGDIVAKVSSGVNLPVGLTEDKFFSQVIMTQADLDAAIAASTTATTAAKV